MWDFTILEASPTYNWTLHSVSLLNGIPGTTEGAPGSEWSAVKFEFKNPEGKVLELFTDGFCWGFAGTGPSGLAKILDDLCVLYGSCNPKRTEALRNWIVSLDIAAEHVLLISEILKASPGA